MKKIYEVSISLEAELLIDEDDAIDEIISDEVYEALKKGQYEITGIEYEEVDSYELDLRKADHMYDLAKGN